MNLVRSFFAACVVTTGVIATGTVLAQPGSIKPATANSDQLSFDQPLAWLHEAKTNYGAVKDYTCNLVSKERVNGKLSDDIMVMKVRTQPFSVYLKWLQPTDKKGQEVVYVQGKNKGKMLVKSPLLGGLTGWHAIDPTDPRVLQHSRHTILEAGIGNMIDQTIKTWEVDRAGGKAKALPPREAEYNGRRCIRIEVVRTERGALPYRSVIFLEKVSKMPIRMENYDLPRQGGPADADKLEEFSYFNIEFNKGLTEAEFTK